MRSFSQITYKGRPAISGVVADISKRRQAQEALRKSDKELRILSNQLLSAEEKERKRIARELHDSIGQALSAIKFSVENALLELRAAANPIDLGFEIVGNLKIRIDLQKTDHVLEELKKIDSLVWVALTTGGTDIDVDFVARSLKELQELIFKKISRIDGIRSTETSLMVDLVKDDHAWGTAWE
jgi:Lrp/AsnC family transcriptional regulator for asnA, asnC and gidA